MAKNVNRENAATEVERLVQIERLCATNDGTNFERDVRPVLEWIQANPHAAARFAVAVHGRGWTGCECDLHKAGLAQFGEAPPLKS